MTKAEFISKLRPTAIAVRNEIGFHHDLGMVQAAHESGYGSSGLSNPASQLEIRIGPTNDAPIVRTGPALNLFGFTAEPGTYWRSTKSSAGNREFVLMLTTEWVEKPVASDTVISGPNANGFYQVKRFRPFRVYKSWDESYRDWARLMQIPTYTNVGAPNALRTGDLKAFAEAMRKAKYATDPNYAAKLEKIGKEGFA